MKKEKIYKGKCKCCKNKIQANNLDNRVNMRSLTRCPDGHTYCPVCHAVVKMR